MVPTKSRPRPTGQVTGAVSSASVFSISSIRSNGSRLSRSSLLMNVMIGMSRSRQTSNSLRVRASMPLAASITMTAEIDRRQRAVGVLREVLVAGRIEQVEHAAAVLEGHHRGDHRDAALALDRHPVRAGGAPVALGLDLPGELDRPAEQQELLGQRGLARVRMRDDRKGAAPLDLGFMSEGANGDVHGAGDVAVPGASIKARVTVRAPRTGRRDHSSPRNLLVKPASPSSDARVPSSTVRPFSIT